MRFGHVVSLGLVCALLSACAGSESADTEEPPAAAPSEPSGDADGDDVDPLDSLISAAQEEGEVTLYTSVTGAGVDVLAEDFESEYGIEVIPLRLTSAVVNQRFLEEANAGAHFADLLLSSDPTFFEIDEADDLFVDFVAEEVPEVAEWPEEQLHPYSAMVSVRIAKMAYNTDTVAEDEVPQEYTDLLDERWRGRVVTADPRGSAGTASHHLMLLEEEGPEFLEGLAANEIVIADSIAPAVQQLAAGEFDISLIANNAHTGTVPNVELTEVPYAGGFPQHVAVAQEARNPNAARLLANWLLTEDGQAALNGGEQASVSPRFDDIEGADTMPTDYRDWQFAEATERADELLALLGG